MPGYWVAMGRVLDRKGERMSVQKNNNKKTEKGQNKKSSQDYNVYIYIY